MASRMRFAGLRFTFHTEVNTEHVTVHHRWKQSEPQRGRGLLALSQHSIAKPSRHYNRPLICSTCLTSGSHHFFRSLHLSPPPLPLNLNGRALEIRTWHLNKFSLTQMKWRKIHHLCLWRMAVQQKCWRWCIHIYNVCINLASSPYMACALLHIYTAQRLCKLQPASVHCALRIQRLRGIYASHNNNNSAYINTS